MPSSAPNTFPGKFSTDFKAEVIAAEMIDSGIPLESILIVMLGAAKRRYRKDVDTVVSEVSKYDHKEYIHINTHKEGIYDMLPEGLFHAPTFSKSAKTQADIIREIKKHKAEEMDARKFFLPFEAAINDLRIQVALHESRLDKRLHSNELVDIFASQWEIFDYLDARQANVFLHLIPLIHDLRDDYEVAATIFEMIFLLPVQIVARPQLLVPGHNGVHSTFDDAVLGVSLTTGNDVFESGEDELLISIGPMENAMLKQFFDGGNQGKILELMCDYLLPVHLDVSIEYLLEDADKVTRLSDHINDYNATLGMNTWL